MRKLRCLLHGLFAFLGANAQVPDQGAYPVYTGNDLGLTYTPAKSVFRVWAPTATNVQLFLYESGTGGKALQMVRLVPAEEGTWKAEISGNLLGKFYTYKAFFPGKNGSAGTWSEEVTDPYAKAVGLNGKRAMVVDLTSTDPVGWDKDKAPALAAPTDAVIYELHVRDASIAASSGIKAKGKYAGLTEPGTKNSSGQPTGLDHLKQLGVTHVHLLPCFDFQSVDESVTDKPQYNWGYDPLNYNTPEGSYSSNAADGRVRIREFKQLVKTLHANGIRVIMDVVYNHTALSEKSNFNQLVPGYYYRQTPEGKWSNATACGNETASEKPMMRKFMLESVMYWAKEYHIDGFRFDLMGVHDIETMNLISKELHAYRPDMLLYGEGWTAGASPLPDSLRALKANAAQLDRIAVFSDDIRDGIKGSVFVESDKGFVSGKPGMEESVKFGIVASVRHPQVDYTKVNYSKAPYADEPFKTITYAECHDNHTLWDKLKLSGAADESQDAPPTDLESMHKLALSVVLTSQGIPFLHAGTEFLRTKEGVENSYNASDRINALDWNARTSHGDVVNYVRGLIALRKAHPAFRMRSAEQIRQGLRFREDLPKGMIGYELNGRSVGDKWQAILVLFNGNREAQTILPGSGNWKAVVRDNRFEEKGEISGAVDMAPFSCTILYREEKP